ncbi:MAG TPA: hypothetical protein VFG72_10205 [Marmoricola sp.]|nr:hypothetical protein [Marmoricola sp.]
MSAPLSTAKLTQLESAYVGAIDTALARRDFVTARKLGEEWDKQATLREVRAGRLSLRRLTRRTPLTREA